MDAYEIPQQRSINGNEFRNRSARQGDVGGGDAQEKQSTQLIPSTQSGYVDITVVEREKGNVGGGDAQEHPSTQLIPSTQAYEEMMVMQEDVGGGHTSSVDEPQKSHRKTKQKAVSPKSLCLQIGLPVLIILCLIISVVSIALVTPSNEDLAMLRESQFEVKAELNISVQNLLDENRQLKLLINTTQNESDVGDAGMKRKLELLERNMGMLEANNTAMDAQLGLLDSKVNALEANNTVMDAQLGLLESKVNTLEVNNTELEVQLNALKESNENLKTQLNSVEQNHATCSSNITSLSTRLTDLRQETFRCPSTDGYEYYPNPHSGTCFRYSQYKNYSAAREFCVKAGEHLPTFATLGSSAWFTDLSMRKGWLHSWVGAYKNSSGSWIWDGLYTESISSEFWVDGEPESGDDCMYYNYNDNGLVRGRSCSSRLHFWCEANRLTD